MAWLVMDMTTFNRQDLFSIVGGESHGKHYLPFVHVVFLNISKACLINCVISEGRWTLDDVERISKGKASKAKTGSRKVPHRLQAGERTVRLTEFTLCLNQ